MKKATIILFILLAFSLHADTIKLRADLWPPYNIAPKSPQPGFMIEIAKSIFEKAGHTIDYQLLPWQRAMRMAEEGKINGLIGLTKDEQPNFIFPEHATGYAEDMFYVHRDSTWHYTGKASLKRVTLGAISGYSYGHDIDDYISKNKKSKWQVQLLFGEKAFYQNIRKLIKGRISAIIANRYVMAHFQQSNKASHFIKEAGKAQSTLLYIGFTPKHPKSREYARLLSDGICNLRQSGQLQTILNRYGLKDWQQPKKPREIQLSKPKKLTIKDSDDYDAESLIGIQFR